MNEPFAPRRISDVETALDISGHFMPWAVNTDQPLMLGTTGTQDCFILLFSTIKALEVFSSLYFKNVLWKVKHIDDGIEMLNSYLTGLSLGFVLESWSIHGCMNLVAFASRKFSERNLMMDKFVVTDQHLKLARAMRVTWNLSGGYFGAPTVDGKRPYGDSEVLQSMVDILELDVKPDEEDGEFPEDLVEQLTHLHEDMAVAIQIFFCTGQIKTGTYIKSERYNRCSWREELCEAL